MARIYVLSEHLEDNGGEVLPHLVMSDVIRWLADNVRARPEKCREIMVWLGQAFQDGDETEREVIAVSCIEMLPDPGETGAELRGFLTPRLAVFDLGKP